MESMLNENEKQKVLNRIRKMLALANNSAATEGERDNAMRMAHATLAKYNLDIAEAEAAGQTTAESRRAIVKRTFYGRPWARRVTHAIADMCFCVNLFTPAKKATDTTHWFIGRESNAVTAADLAEYLVKSIWQEAHRAARARGMGNEYARNFATGASSRVAERCAALKREAGKTEQPVSDGPRMPSGPSTALVLASFYAKEQTANDDFLNIHIPDRKKEVAPRAKAVHNASAFTQGSAYGATLSLNRAVTGTKQARIK